MRVDYALRQHDQWYKGDGVYGDGPSFHWDYYNSFVIQPMLLDVLDACRDEMPAWKELVARASTSARAATPRSRSASSRPTAVSRRSADRSPTGAARSSCSRRCALRRALPDGVSPAQVRGALTAVIRKHARGAGHVRRGRLAAHRLLRPPARSRRNLHLDRQPLSLLGRVPAARPRRERSVLVGAARAVDVSQAWSGQAFPIDHAI